MRVLPGYMAFPGGVLEEEDFVTGDAWLSAPEPFAAPASFAASPSLGRSAGADPAGAPRERLYAALLSAAVRELQEEVGLALTSAPSAAPDGGPADAGLRRGVGGPGAPGMPGMPGMTGLSGDSAQGLLTAVRYIGRRVTPAMLLARFDAHFFAARAATPDAPFVLAATEVESAFWLSPGAVLTDSGCRLAPPTRDVLEMLCAFPDLDQLFASGFLPEQRYI